MSDVGIARQDGAARLPPDAPPVRLTTGFRGSNPRTWALKRPATIIGSRRPAHIVIHHHEVSAAHCAVIHTGRGVFLMDLHTPGGTRVNGAGVELVALSDRDVIAVGDTEFRVRIDAAAPRARPVFRSRGRPVVPDEPSTLAPRALVFQDADGEHAWRVTRVAGVIGRRAGVAVCLGDPCIGEIHALVCWCGDRWIIHDLEGRGGVIVNRWPARVAALSVGDVCQIGSMALTVLGAAAMAARRAASVPARRATSVPAPQTTGVLASRGVGAAPVHLNPVAHAKDASNPRDVTRPSAAGVPAGLNPPSTPHDAPNRLDAPSPPAAGSMPTPIAHTPATRTADARTPPTEPVPPSRAGSAVASATGVASTGASTPQVEGWDAQGRPTGTVPTPGIGSAGPSDMRVERRDARTPHAETAPVSRGGSARTPATGVGSAGAPAVTGGSVEAPGIRGERAGALATGVGSAGIPATGVESAGAPAGRVGSVEAPGVRGERAGALATGVEGAGAPTVPGERAGAPVVEAVPVAPLPRAACDEVRAQLAEARAGLDRAWARLNRWKLDVVDRGATLTTVHTNLARRVAELDARDAGLRGLLHDLTCYHDLLQSCHGRLTALLSEHADPPD